MTRGKCNPWEQRQVGGSEGQPAWRLLGFSVTSPPLRSQVHSTTADRGLPLPLSDLSLIETFKERALEVLECWTLTVLFDCPACSVLPGVHHRTPVLRGRAYISRILFDERTYRYSDLVFPSVTFFPRAFALLAYNTNPIQKMPVKRFVHILVAVHRPYWGTQQV